jgi:hypothetical protein
MELKIFDAQSYKKKNETPLPQTGLTIMTIIGRSI